MANDDPAKKDEDSADAPEKVRPWAALTSPSFRTLLGTFAFGSFGLEMRIATNLFVVYLLSNDPLQIALLGVFQFIPLIVFGLLGGSFADRFNRKKLLVFAQGGNFAVGAALAALAFAGMLEVWHVHAATFITASTNVFDSPARMGLIYGSVPRAYLMNAITMNTSVRYGTGMLGPVMGGALLDWTGASGTYAINAVLIVPAVAGLFFLGAVPGATPEPSKAVFTPRQMLAGFKFFFSAQIILALIVMDMVGTMFTAHKAVTPIFATDILGVGTAGGGLLMAAVSAGFLLGSTVLIGIGDIRRKGVLVIVTFIGYALAIALFAVSRSFALSLVAMVLIGALDGVGVITRQATLQLLVPEEIRGRATAALQITNRSAPSLGFVVTGAMAAALGAPNALLLGSGLTIAVVLLVTVSWREVTRFKT